MENSPIETDSEICGWLEKIIENGESSRRPLAFEQNKKTLAALRLLMRLNESAEETTQEKNKNLERWLEGISRDFGFDYSNDVILSKFRSIFSRLRSDRVFQGNLDTLARLCNGHSNNLHHSDASALFRKECDLSHRLSLLRSDCRFLDEQLNRLKLQTKNLDQSSMERRQLEDANRGKTSENLTSISYMHKKSQRYTEDLNNLQHELYQVRSFDPARLSRSKLAENDNENEELAKELDQLRKSLELYRNLPPSVVLARLKLEESRKQLDQLKNQVLLSGIDSTVHS